MLRCLRFFARLRRIKPPPKEIGNKKFSLPIVVSKRYNCSKRLNSQFLKIKTSVTTESLSTEIKEVTSELSELTGIMCPAVSKGKMATTTTAASEGKC